MSSPTRYAFILGAHPALSVAELHAVLPGMLGSPVKINHQGPVAFVSTAQPLDASALMERLGGTVKIVEVIGPFDPEQITEWMFSQIDYETKFNFGFSIYALDGTTSSARKEVRVIQQLGLSLKRALKEAEVSCRFVSSREPILSSVIVHKERLLKNGVEIVLLKRGSEIEFGKTLAVQPFQSFSKRDYGRPQRDVRSGMLPPKLARMLVNLSQPTTGSVILDPFCGSGTVLQEALLLGYTHVIGSDISAKAMDDTKRNLEWLHLEMPQMMTASAQELVQRRLLKPHSIDRIVFEGYLGPPTPYAAKLAGVMRELQALYESVFPVLAELLKKDGIIVAALPFWHIQHPDVHLNIARIARSAGMEFDEPLLYRRPQSVVGREIVVLRKTV